MCVCLQATGGDCGVLRVGALYGPVEKIGESTITVNWGRRWGGEGDISCACVCLHVEGDAQEITD
jgi:hypothetical protein